MPKVSDSESTGLKPRPIEGFGFGEGLGLGIWGLCFREGLGIRVSGFWGFGIRVQGAAIPKHDQGIPSHL